jgi:TatD DNase family protein
MTYIDTHAHLYSESFDEDRSEMIQRALDAGVNKLFLPNIDEASIEGMEALVDKYPGVCYSMMGIHPCDVQKDWQVQLERIQLHFKPERHIAIGEIGIDLYWDKSLQEEQTASFRAQIRWAKAVQLPIVIHCRDSFDEIFAVLDEENDDQLSGIFHCFTGTAGQGRKILSYGGFKLGIGGVVTFKNSGLDKAIADIGPEHLVLETDAPYLTPTPYRGKRNESAYIPLIAEKLSSIFSIDEKEIGTITSRNALEIFKLSKH